MNIGRVAYFIYSLITKKNGYFYIGGFPKINNLGDQSLFLAYKKILGQDLIHFQGGRIQTFIAKVFKVEHTKAFLAGGTLINRLGLFSLRDAFKVFNKIYVIGTGVAQNYFWSTQSGFINETSEWMEALKKASYLSVRGPLGKNLLEENGVSEVEIFGDPVITFALPEKRVVTNKKVIGINVGVSKDAAWVSEEVIFKLYYDLVTKLLHSNWEIHWLVVCDSDLQITKKVASETKTEQFIHVFFNDPSKYIQLCQEMCVFIGLKLHSVVLAHCAYTPSIMLEYRPKCLDYMLSIGEDDNCFRLDKINAEQIFARICELFENQDQFIVRLYENINMMKKNQAKQINKLLSS